MIINIEGTDGCGKKTQTDLLFKFLTEKGYKVKKISFPNYESESSSLVKMYLRGEFGDNDNLNGFQASMFYAVDRLATMLNINLEDYDYVLFDRYVPSNMIHQSTRIKDNVELDKFLDWVIDLEYGKLKLPKPDKTLFLDVPVQISMMIARGKREFEERTR